MVFVAKLLSGVTSFNQISPRPCRHRGMIKQSKWRLSLIHIPEPSTRLSIPESVSCEVVVCWLFHQGARLHRGQHWPIPCCFALRDANAGRLQCLRSLGSAWQRAPTGSLPRKKPLRESWRPQWNTCFTKGLQASASSLVSLTETLAQCSYKWKRDPEEKKKKHTEALEATSVNNAAESVYLFKIQQNILSPACGLKDERANIIWSDKKPPVFRSNRYTVSQLF